MKEYIGTEYGYENEEARAPCGCCVEFNDDIITCEHCGKSMCPYCFASDGHVRQLCESRTRSILINDRTRVEAALKETSADLRAKHFDGRVQIVHHDGSVMSFNRATIIKFEVWFMIFTENCGHHIFHEADLDHINKVFREDL